MLGSLLILLVPAAVPSAPQFDRPVNLTDVVEGPQDLELIDIDGDGILDLRLSSTFMGIEGARGLHWLRGRGAGAFGLPREIASASSPTDPDTFIQDSASGDVDADGDVDVVACIPVPGPGQRVVLLANRGDGTFDSPVDVATLPGSAPSLLLLDWDADGDDDVFFGSQDAFPSARGSFALIESLGPGSFAVPVDVDPTGAPATDLVAPGDLDGDGDVDVAVRRDGEAATWYRNEGSLPFAGPFRLSETPLIVPQDAADFDGNGTLDVLLASRGRIEWSRNLGGGAFEPVQEVDYTEPNLYSFSSVQSIDIDRDGDVDIIGLRDRSSGGWYENLGGGAFSARQLLPG
ncbi:MAG: VCBS repeat-containing protein, partial [Planctomycetota bacterium]